MRSLLLTPDTADAVLAAAAHALMAGGVAVIPTDTVYGLAAHPGHPEAVQRLYTIKGREAAKPIALLAADAAAVARAGADWPPAGSRLAERFWPGALTLVLTCHDNREEGFRVPAHVWTRRLLSACGGILRVTSANLSGSMPAASAAAALADVGLESDLIVDDGPSPGGVASTVVRVTAGGSQLLRVGAISRAEIEGAVRLKTEDSNAEY